MLMMNNCLIFLEVKYSEGFLKRSPVLLKFLVVSVFNAGAQKRAFAVASVDGNYGW